MSKEAMKLALEALDIVNPREFAQADPDGKIDKAITALRLEIDALNMASTAAKPDFWEGYVPEPVKPATEESSATQAQQALDKKAENARELGLDYEPAQPYKSIADHINQATNGGVQIDPVTGDVSIGTPSTPSQQEPVAWMDIDEKGAFSGLRYWSEPDNRHEVALYTFPQRTWVGLTPEERDHIWNTVGNSDAHGDVDGRSGEDVMDAIEAKLKERNT